MSLSQHCSHGGPLRRSGPLKPTSSHGCHLALSQSQLLPWPPALALSATILPFAHFTPAPSYFSKCWKNYPLTSSVLAALFCWLCTCPSCSDSWSPSPFQISAHSSPHLSCHPFPPRLTQPSLPSALLILLLSFTFPTQCHLTSC